MKKLAVLSIALAIPFSAWCQKPAPDDKHKEELKKDVDLGKDYVKELEKDLKFSKDEAKNARVVRIGTELAALANALQVDAGWGDGRLNAFEYTFKVIEDKDVNAFSVPGGFIYVYTGLLDDVESDDELAGVLAHEISHAAHRHMVTLIRERSKVDAWTLPIAIAALLAGSPQAGTVLVGSQLLSTALTSGWSEKAELDADQTAFHYIIKSKYRPAGLLTFLERLAFKEKRNSPNIQWGIYRTHPPSVKRVREVVSLIKKADLPIERSAVTTSFRVTSAKSEAGFELKFGTTRLFEFKGPAAESRAGEAAAQLNGFFDSSPELFSIRRDGAKIVWLGRTLLTFTTDDGDPSEEAAKAAKVIKDCLFSLSYRTGG